MPPRNQRQILAGLSLKDVRPEGVYGFHHDYAVCLVLSQETVKIRTGLWQLVYTYGQYFCFQGMHLRNQRLRLCGPPALPTSGTSSPNAVARSI
jgi:hypothetical protein